MTPADVAAALALQRSLDARVVDLARGLSLATRIETELVRLMRRALFPESDAGLEANLWFSPLVAERDTLGIALVPACRDELRHELMLPEHRPALDTAWDVIVRSHRPAGQAGVPPVVAIHEAIGYHAIVGAAAGDSTHRQRMQLELGTLLRALDEDRDGSLGRWLVRALPTLPEPARHSPAAIALAEKLRQRTLVEIASIPRPEFDASRRWGGDAIAVAAVGCRRRTDGIEFSIPPATDAHVMEAPRTAPVVVEVQTPRRSGWAMRQVELPHTGVRVEPDPTPGSRCRITTADGRRVAVQPSYEDRKPVLFVVNRWQDEDPRFQQIFRVATELGWETRAHDNAPGEVDAVLLLLDTGTESTAGILPGIAPFVEAQRPILAFTAEGLRPLGELPTRAVLEHGGPTYSAEYSPDGGRIVTSGDGGVLVWDASSGERLLTHRSEQITRTATFNRDGTQIVIASNDGTIALWPLDGTPHPIPVHDDWVMSADFSASGHRIVTASQDHSAAVWDVDRLPDRPDAVRLVHRAAVNHASLSPDESMVATASDDRTAVLWRAIDGTRLATLQHDVGVNSAVWSPDGRTVLTADADRNVWMWDPATGERDGVRFGHRDEVHFAAFSRDGRRIAAASASGLVTIWHVPSRAIVAELAHAGPAEPIERYQAKIRSRRLRPRGVLSIAFSPDDATLLTAGVDGRTVAWDVSGPFSHDTWVRSLAEGGPPVVPRPMRLVENELEELRAQLLALDDRRLLAWSVGHSRAGQRSESDDQADTRAVTPTPAAGHDGGRHALVAIISAGGIDVLHQAFLDAGGRSRIAAIWDQTDPTGPAPDEFQFGTLHTDVAIQRYVDHQSVPPSLGRNAAGAATHAASVAVGRPTTGQPGGLAADAAIVAVVTSGTFERYADEHIAALRFVAACAERVGRPVVVLVGSGIHAGGHDGRSALEIAFNEFSQGGRHPGRVVVVPAGNQGHRRHHAVVPLHAGHLTRVTLSAGGAALARLRVEAWWPSASDSRFRLHAANGATSNWVGGRTATDSGQFEDGTTYQMQLVRYHVDSGDSQLMLHLTDNRASDNRVWHLEVDSTSVREPGGDLHAWITSDAASDRPPEFIDFVSEDCTLVVPATAESVLAVGAVDGSRPAVFTSHGPTRDRRPKPEVCAQGMNVLGARGGTAADGIALNGTFPAAAHVAGGIAVALSTAAASGRMIPTAIQVRRVAQQATHGSTPWDRQLGYGVIDIEAFLSAWADSQAS